MEETLQRPHFREYFKLSQCGHWNSHISHSLSCLCIAVTPCANPSTSVAMCWTGLRNRPQLKIAIPIWVWRNRWFLISQSGSQAVEVIFPTAGPAYALLQSIWPLLSLSHTDWGWVFGYRAGFQCPGSLNRTCPVSALEVPGKHQDLDLPNLYFNRAKNSFPFLKGRKCSQIFLYSKTIWWILVLVFKF